MKLVGWLLTFGVAMSAGAHAQMSLEEAVNADHRPAAHRARDGYRHPVDTISFFGTKPTDKVLEIWPGDGWYTEILAPYLKEQGKYTAAVYPLNKINSKDKQEAYRSKKSREFVDRFSDKDVYGKVKFVDYGTGPQKAKFKANYYDAVYAIRIVHVWDEVGRLSKGFIDAYKALKPGGVLAIVAHRSNDMADGVS
jgi:predicted methyltransferase